MNDNLVNKLQQTHFQTLGEINESKKDKILIMGIGNYLLADEGVGVHAIHELATREIPVYVDIVDGATGSFELIPVLAAYRRVIMIDATMDEQEPGSITVLYPRFSADFPVALSSHDIGLKDLFDALEFSGEMPRLILITVTIKEILTMRVELSEKVQAAMPKLADIALDLAFRINNGELLKIS
jgi:hydrogenase maturation protease